ncbi:prefoldin subunit protein [Cyclospora cayetanensis]|uniref:Prefoldin subunit protein n=1 Tax=Cyclospora cayetanensis TaxID=88456 RepID=A0A1D3CYN6_9EIME|nr:prefoldin subunit protein [Cyclospora cayetanensis]
MASEIDVSEEAQKRLCRFSYLSHSIGTMEERLAVLKKKITALSDASEEVEVSFTDDDLWIKVGECYVQQSADGVQEHLSAAQEETRAELRKLDNTLAAYRSEMLELKAKLYAEFGNRVNLDK